MIYVSCSSDDGDGNPLNPNNEAYQPNFIDQDLQGQIEGENWTYVDGVVSTSQFTGDTSYTTFLSVSVESQDSALFCSLNNPDNKSYVLFILEHDEPILQPVSKTLNFDFTSDENFTVTLVSYSDTSNIPFNRIVTQGALEILEVDTAQRIVTGRMDVRDELEGDANNVNGNFSLRYCDF